jgi:uncharacterized protein (DUF1778 family)
VEACLLDRSKVSQQSLGEESQRLCIEAAAARADAAVAVFALLDARAAGKQAIEDSQRLRMALRART